MYSVTEALCELHCLPKEKRYMLPIKFASKVEDGTPCTADSRDLCIGGICYVRRLPKTSCSPCGSSVDKSVQVSVGAAMYGGQ